MTAGRQSHFGSETRAHDGYIVTFAHGKERWQRHFYQTVVTHDKNTNRRVVKHGKPSIVQAIEYADRNGAKIACISSPETILRDMAGSRYGREGKRMGQNHDNVHFPERAILSKYARLDLWLPPLNAFRPAA